MKIHQTEKAIVDELKNLYKEFIVTLRTKDVLNKDILLAINKKIDDLNVLLANEKSIGRETAGLLFFSFWQIRNHLEITKNKEVLAEVISIMKKQVERLLPIP